MKDHSLLRLGGACAILLGIAKLLGGALYFVVPPEQRLTMPGAVFLPSFAQDSTFLMVIFWLEALVGVLGLAIVPALSNLTRSLNEGWVRWTGNFALVGFAVSAVGYTTSIARLPGIAAAFVKGDAATQAALAVVWKSSPDLLGIWGYGLIGVWVLVVSWLSMKSTTFPKTLTYVGFALAVLYILVPVSLILRSQALSTITVAAGAVVAVIWYVWLGTVLRRTANA